jgi:hypothetical protein
VQVSGAMLGLSCPAFVEFRSGLPVYRDRWRADGLVAARSSLSAPLELHGTQLAAARTKRLSFGRSLIARGYTRIPLARVRGSP